MANEHIIVERYGFNNEGNQIRYTVADGVSVSKGSLMALYNPRTVSGAGLADLYYAGVSAEEKVSGDGVTSISVMTDALMKAVASGAITAGHPVTGCDLNRIKEHINGASGAAIIGYALETFADGETKQYRLAL